MDDGQVTRRAAIHRALGDEHRVRIVDALWLGDRSPGELAGVTGLSSNLVAFHLGVLEEVGLVARVTSEGDRRRRYVRLGAAATEGVLAGPPVSPPVTGTVLFVCTANSARSQLAAALWTDRTGRPAGSAGRLPAPAVHPLAVATAAAHGLDLAAARPRRYDEVPAAEVVVSVCDQAHEAGPPPATVSLHWSVPDPVGHDLDRFETAFGDLDRRIDRLATALVTTN